MKLQRGFKGVFLVTLFALYLSGVIVWVLGQWWQVDVGFGLSPSPWRLVFLQSHSVVGLWFLLIFGYFYRIHIEKSWPKKRKRGSGVGAFLPWIVLILTVPGLFYLTDESAKWTVVQIHTWVGIAAVFPFVLHKLTP